MFGRTRSLLRRGNAAREAGNWPAARDAYAEALARKPGLAHIWVQYGHMLRQTGAETEALAAYRRSDALAPDAPDTLHQIGRSLAILDQPEAALAVYERAIALQPALPGLARELGALRRLLRRRGGVRPDGLPWSLRFINLGTTGTCNASCIHCPTGKSTTAHVPRGTMPMALFRKIVDGLVEHDIHVTDQIAFGLFGDALVDPLVVQRAEYLHERLPDVVLSINTNGAAFNPARHARLNQLPLKVALHCESLVPATFDYLMQPLRAERVFPKYESLLDTFPGKVIVSVPTSRANLGELPSIRAWFRARGAADVVSDPLSSRCAEDRSLFDSLAINPVRIRCGPNVLDDLIVDCDGQVLVCCQDFARVEGIGNLQTETFAEVVTSLARHNVRKAFAERRHDEFATCSRCYADVREVAVAPQAA